MPILRLSGIKKRFGATVALDGVDIELGPGQVHAVIGENGAGKSTLMNIISGAVKPDSGEMELDGRPYQPSSPAAARDHGISLIHQELSLFPHLTVAENIVMGIEPATRGLMDFEAARNRAVSLTADFDHPEIRPEAQVRSLPIALRQVVEICRAMASNARIVLMDEPTSSLQGRDVARLFSLIRRLRDDGVSVVYISHFLEEVREIADSYTVLRDGKNVSSGTICDVTDDELIAQMVGRPVEMLFPDRPARVAGETVLEVKGLSAPPLLKEASFRLRKGEVLGIAGLMGSGRSELVRAIFGLAPGDSGTIWVHGHLEQAQRAGPAHRISQGVGYISEDRQGEGLALAMPIADNITMTRMSALSRFGWISRARQRKQAEKWASRIAIRTHDVMEKVRRLSGGNQQKVALARLLHQNVDILLLDEPTRGIDIGSKAQVYSLIEDLAAEGKAILMISSYIPELFGVCDRLAVMSRGRLSETRAIDQWTPESVMQAAIGAGIKTNGYN
jgi:ribose transport system ATP-binding protein